MVTQLGISMLAPLILCVCVGIWLDDTFGWSTTAVLVVLGIMAGARNTWMLAQQVGLPRQKRRKRMKRQINNTLLELITGIIISAAVVEVLSILVAGFSWEFTSGLWIGAATAIGLAAHMYRSIDRALDMQPDDADNTCAGLSDPDCRDSPCRGSSYVSEARICDGYLCRRVLPEVRSIPSAADPPDASRKGCSCAGRDGRRRSAAYRFLIKSARQIL